MEPVLEALRAAVKESPVKTAEVAAALGVVPSTLWRMLVGHNRMSVDQFLVICREVRVDPAEILAKAEAL